MRDLNEPYRLDRGQIECYRENGHLKVEHVLSEETLADYGEELTEVVRSIDAARMLEQFTADYGPDVAATIKRGLASSARNPESTYARAFTQRPNLWRYSRKVEAFVRSKRLARLAADLMGVEGVRLYHDQALFKEARGGHTPWHVDQFYWPLSNSSTVTAWIPLQAVPMEMGPVAFANGSHKDAADGLAAKLAISDESEAQLSELMQGLEVDCSPFDSGDVSFHSGWTCHRAGANQTERTRGVFTIIYMDRDIRLIEPEHDQHRTDARMWVPGVAPGEVAASRLNPVLFER